MNVEQDSAQPKRHFGVLTPMQWRDRHSLAQHGDWTAKAESVRVPQPHEGVGNALRNVFVANASCLPGDMAKLLEKLV